MNTYICRENNYWTVRIKSFPKEKRTAVQELADSKRLSIGAYIGNLLDEQIKQNKEARA